MTQFSEREIGGRIRLSIGTILEAKGLSKEGLAKQFPKARQDGSGLPVRASLYRLLADNPTGRTNNPGVRSLIAFCEAAGGDPGVILDQISKPQINTDLRLNIELYLALQELKSLGKTPDQVDEIGREMRLIWSSFRRNRDEVSSSVGQV